MDRRPWAQPGIAPADLDQVTERFYRGGGAPSGGSGLGLAIARQLAEKWGGTLEVMNGDEGGTRVEVQLHRLLDAFDGKPFNRSVRTS